jgi:hypothetical protein
MQTIKAFKAGVIATLPMTLILYSVSLLKLPPVDIFRILGKLITPKNRLAVVVGIVLHFVTGGVFGLVYAALWQAGIGRTNWHWGLGFGAVHGLGAHWLMKHLLASHPRRPQFYSPARGIIYIISHLVFGGFVARYYSKQRKHNMRWF